MGKLALVVDDSVTMQNMVSVALKELGFDVNTALDGTSASKLAEGAEYDVIVTDINMPNMDGIELIHYLRRLPNCKKTPILVLTTESGDNAKSAGRSAGASGWIVKPFNPVTLKAAVKKLCSL
jgi:two-component system, chemotaxis family, chemotaxis protein CheY